MGTGGHNVPIILDSVGIRKLTPKECLRLQGFLNYDISGLSDSCVYNLCGNSITTDVLDLIFKQLLKKGKNFLI
jgi:DNA (cytosine-5)-methyltransferase 1